MNNRSVITLKSELDVFTLPPTQLAIEDSSLLEIHPISTITDDTSPIEFYIEGNGQNYLDLSHTFLHIKARIIKKNGTDLIATDKVTTVNYPLNTCFSQCNIFLNDKQVSSQVNYAYRCIFESLLFYNEKSQNTFLRAGLFFKDTVGQYEETDPTKNNQALNYRYKYTKDSKIFDLLGPLHIDLGNQDKLLVNGVSLRIKLERSKDSFLLMSTKDDYKFQIKQATLLMRKVEINASISIAHEKALDIGMMKYPIRKIDIKIFTLATGIQSSTISNAYIGNLPTRIIIAFVSNQSFNGNIMNNPFLFKNYDLNYICLIKENKMIPSKPYTPNFENDSFVRSYFTLFTELKSYYHENFPNVSYEEYKSGMTFFVFDLTPDYSASETHMSVITSSNLSIDLKFSKPLPETVNVIAYSEQRNLIEIDKSRTVFTDF